MPTKREAEPTTAPAPKRLRDNESTDCSDALAPFSNVADYECSICLSLLVEPVVGHCGHDFCKSCLEEWRDRTSSGGNAGVSCPVCRQVAMAPGVHSLGTCVRLQRLIEQQFPEELEERRAEVSAARAELHAARQKEAQLQAAAVQHIMRARYSWAAQIMAAGPSSWPASTSRPASVNVPAMTRAARIDYNHQLNTPNNQLQAPLAAAAVQGAGLATLSCGQGHTMTSAISQPVSAIAPSWQNPAADALLRQSTVQTLVEMFIARRPNMSVSFRQRLPNLIRKLEEVLYRTARSRDEYADQQMLHARVQAVARRLTEQRCPTRIDALPSMPMSWAPMTHDVSAAQLMQAN